MISILITALTFLLILVSLFLILVILMQRGSANAGLGSAFGAGVTEGAFGAEAGNVLTKATIWTAVAFFGLSLTTYLLYMAQIAQGEQAATDAEVLNLANPAQAVIETAPAATTDAGTATEGVETPMVTPEVTNPFAAGSTTEGVEEVTIPIPTETTPPIETTPPAEEAETIPGE